MFAGFGRPAPGEPRPPEPNASTASGAAANGAPPPGFWGVFDVPAWLGLSEEGGQPAQQPGQQPPSSWMSAQVPAQQPQPTKAPAARGGGVFGGGSWMDPLLGRRAPETPPGSPKRASADERMARYIEAAASLSESRAPQCAAVLRALKPGFAMLLHLLILVFTGYARIYGRAYELYQGLPLNCLQMVLGLLLCMFGGTYVALIAAVEAFRTMGAEALFAHLSYVAGQARTVMAASARDDRMDQNKDGIADVDQISPQELTQRKIKVCMVAVAEPERLQAAVGSLWAACLAVLATLKFQFAQTTAYALAIAEMVKFPVVRALAPTMTWGLGKELQHWVDPAVDSVLKVVCILLVWYLEKIRAAFYSGVRGGKMFAEALICFCQEKGIMDKLPDFIARKPFDPSLSYLDEAIGYTVAAFGFYWQISHAFFLPFPIDWLLWPVTFAEQLLEVQISWS